MHIAIEQKPDETKPALKETQQIALDSSANAVAQAAARAVSTACPTVRTPANALGFLFYGAAAYACSQTGLTRTVDFYDKMAAVAN